jgi:large subunit ribosomal protein L17
MRHRKNSFKIGRTSAHRKALLANQTCSLIYASEIRTTIVKAKETRRVAEKMVTLAKKGTLHDRRRAISKIRDVDAVRVLFEDIAPKYESRNGGYTRIIRLGQRKGDGAEMCILQWVEENKPKAKKTEKKAEAVKEEAKAETKTEEPKAVEEKAEVKAEAKVEEPKAE